MFHCFFSFLYVLVNTTDALNKLIADNNRPPHTDMEWSAYGCNTRDDLDNIFNSFDGRHFNISGTFLGGRWREAAEVIIMCFPSFCNFLKTSLILCFAELENDWKQRCLRMSVSHLVCVDFITQQSVHLPFDKESITWDII